MEDTLTKRRCGMGTGVIKSTPTRREFIKKGAILMASTAALQTDGACILAASGSKDKKAEGKKAEEVSPGEDLMREHGVLARILLIYDDISFRLEKGINYPPEVPPKAAGLVQQFVEDYHEKLEEEYVFPRLVKTGKLGDLVNFLLEQHQAERRLTERITNFTCPPVLKPMRKRNC
jgi:hypothetical protein